MPPDAGIVLALNSEAGLAGISASLIALKRSAGNLLRGSVMFPGVPHDLINLSRRRLLLEVAFGLRYLT
jgi:hypothetical protein